MVSLIDEYEQQYAALTAELTSKISLLGNQFVADKKKIIADIDKHMEEAQELLEQMELEVRSIESSIRPRYSMRLDSYKTELGRLNNDIFNAQDPDIFDNPTSLDDYYGDGFHNKDEETQKLLDNSEKIERSGKQLKAGCTLILETEALGSSILKDLYCQRETIERSRNRLRETDADLNRSSRVLNTMSTLSQQNKFILYIIAAIIVIVIIITIYFSM